MIAIKQIEHDYKHSNLELVDALLQAVAALKALGYSEQKAHDLISKWNDEVEAAEPNLYRFYLFIRDGNWYSFFEEGANKLTKEFINEFIRDNQDKLLELWARLLAIPRRSDPNWVQALEVWTTVPHCSRPYGQK
jgi:hypothetical protein